MYLTAPVNQWRGNVPKDGFGPCKPSCMDDPNGFVSFRKDKGYIAWTRTAGQGLFVPADTSITLFTKGEDQEDTTGGWPADVAKSSPDTSLFENGSPIDDDTMCWEVSGMGVDVYNPGTWEERAVAPTGWSFASPEWLEAYEDKLVERTIEFFGIEYSHGVKKCEWQFGNISDWVKNTGSVGPNQTTNGPRAATGTYIPFETADYMPGGVNASNKLRVKISSPAGYMLEVSEKASPATVVTAYVPVEVVLYGRAIPRGCKNGPVCLPDGMSQEQAQAALLAGLTPDELEAIAAIRRKANGG